MNWTNWAQEIAFAAGQIEALKAMMIRDMPDDDFLERNPGDQPYAARVRKAVGMLNEVNAVLLDEQDAKHKDS